MLSYLQASTGNVYMHKDGSIWSLYLYPCGNSSAKPDFISLYAKVLALPQNAKALKFDGKLTFSQWNGEQASVNQAAPQIFQK